MNTTLGRLLETGQSKYELFKALQYHLKLETKLKVNSKEKSAHT